MSNISGYIKCRGSNKVWTLRAVMAVYWPTHDRTPVHMSHESKNWRLLAPALLLCCPLPRIAATAQGPHWPHSTLSTPTLAMVTLASGNMELLLPEQGKALPTSKNLVSNLYKLTVSKVYWMVGCVIICKLEL